MSLRRAKHACCAGECSSRADRVVSQLSFVLLTLSLQHARFSPSSHALLGLPVTTRSDHGTHGYHCQRRSSGERLVASTPDSSSTSREELNVLIWAMIEWTLAVQSTILGLCKWLSYVRSCMARRCDPANRALLHWPTRPEKSGTPRLWIQWNTWRTWPSVLSNGR